MSSFRQPFFGIVGEFLRRDKIFRRLNRGIYISKSNPKDWYKGRGCLPMGRHTRKGGYIVEKSRIPVFVIPDLENFEVFLLKKSMFYFLIPILVETLRFLSDTIN